MAPYSGAPRAPPPCKTRPISVLLVVSFAIYSDL
jgi:hypothetical protein